MVELNASVFFEPASEALKFLPEGPRQLDPATWPRPGNWMAWVSIQHGPTSTMGSVNLFNLDTKENRSFELPGRPGFLAETTAPGTLLVGMERELILLDVTTSPPDITYTGHRIIDHPNTIINDGLATPFGIIFGTKDLNFEKSIGHLYLYRYEDRSLVTLRDGQVCSNGKIVQQAGETWRLLDIDTPTLKIVSYDIDPATGTLGAPHTVVDFAGESHFPDGMRPTPDGNSAIIAFYNPHDVKHGTARQVHLETGRTEAEWYTSGSARVTCPELLELDGQVKLLLTTAVEGMPEAQRRNQPHAGSMFIADTPFSGPVDRPPTVPIEAF